MQRFLKYFFTFYSKLYIMYESAGCGSVWLERTAGGREVAGSNPVTPMNKNYYTLMHYHKGSDRAKATYRNWFLICYKRDFNQKAMVV